MAETPDKEINACEKPQNLRERRAFYRFFYNTNPIVANFIDENSYKSCGLGNLIHPGGRSERRLYIHDFFEEMWKRLNLFEITHQIIHEYLIMGNCITFTEDNDIKTKKRSSPLYDTNPSYQGWKKIFILSLDQVRIRKIPLSVNVHMDYIPDPMTLGFIKKNKELNKLQKKGIISLNTDPNSGSFFAHLFSRKIAPYDTIGISFIERYVQDLSGNKSISMKISKNEIELLNMKLKRFIEEYLFKPVALKKGFLTGGHGVLYPEVIIK